MSEGVLFDLPWSYFKFRSFFRISSSHFLTMKAWCSVRTADTRTKPSGRLLGASPPARASRVSRSRSVNSKRAGRGVSRALAIASMIFKEGFAFPFVRSDRKETETPASSARSCFVIPLSSISRRMFVKNIWLYSEVIDIRV